jgi:hypothetical protein
VLVLTVDDVLHRTIHVTESSLNLLLGVSNKGFSFLNGLLFIALSSQLIMADSQFLEALLAGVAAKQL